MIKLTKQKSGTQRNIVCTYSLLFRNQVTLDEIAGVGWVT